MFENCILKIKKLDEDAIIPKYQTPGSVGFDLHAIVSEKNHLSEDIDMVSIPSMSQKIISTGLAVAIPEGYEMQIRPRSGLSFKHKITITNSPGTIDQDYRDELKVILYNLGTESFVVKSGDRIAQAVIVPILKPLIVEVKDFSEKEKKEDRGGGFGSTGI